MALNKASDAYVAMRTYRESYEDLQNQVAQYQSLAIENPDDPTLERRSRDLTDASKAVDKQAGELSEYIARESEYEMEDVMHDLLDGKVSMYTLLLDDLVDKEFGIDCDVPSSDEGYSL